MDRFERFSFAVFEITRCWHKIAGEEMKKYGLKGTCAVYLRSIAKHPEGLTAANLSEITGKDKADVSRAVSAMIAKGLIIRECESQKSYRAPLILTEEGKIAVSHIENCIRVAVEMGSKGLIQEKREIFYESLELIVSNLQTLSKQGLPKGE